MIASDPKNTISESSVNNNNTNISRDAYNIHKRSTSLTAKSINAERFIPKNKQTQWDELPSIILVPPPMQYDDSNKKNNYDISCKLHHWVHDPIMRRSNFDLCTFNLLNHLPDGIRYMLKCLQCNETHIFTPYLLYNCFYSTGLLGNVYQSILCRRNTVLQIQEKIARMFRPINIDDCVGDEKCNKSDLRGFQQPTIKLIRKQYKQSMQVSQQHKFPENRIFQTTPETLARVCDEVEFFCENRDGMVYGLESAMELNGCLQMVCKDYLTKMTMVMDMERLQALEDLKAYDLYSCRFDYIEIPPPRKPIYECPECRKQKKVVGDKNNICPYHLNLFLSGSSSATTGRMIKTSNQFKHLPQLLSQLGKITGEKVVVYLNVPGVAENRPLICIGDLVRFRFGKEEVIGEVGEVQVKTEMIMCFLPVPAFEVCPRYFNALTNPKNRILENIDSNFGRFDVRFGLFNARAHDIFKSVLSYATAYSMPHVMRILTPSPFLERVQKKSVRRPQIGISDWANPLNTEQKHAVFDILRNNHGQAPYCIYGPPGTGKTMTVIESIYQILNHDMNSKILVCAPSDAACDVITIRLLGLLHSIFKVKRVNWWSRNPSSLPPALLACSSINEAGFFVLPSEEEMKDASVIVCQCFVAGCLELESKQNQLWTSNHFTHVFIDESSQSFEFESLIPLFKVGKDCSIILAGDPRQLGPTVRNQCASLNGLSLSLQERLMGLSLYQMNSNYSVITKLLDNYRSHNALLQVPSELFYSGSLRCRASLKVTSSCEKFELLHDGHNFPMMVYDVDDGMENNKMDTPSFYNVKECDTVVKLIKALLASPNVQINAGQIAVITCFRAQVLKMREILRASSFGSINVGVVEDFQGQEFAVVLISTVLTKNQDRWRKGAKGGLGFMTDPKRFNVAITRASALCVIVGKVQFLESSGSYWTALIEHVKRHGGISGDSKFIANENGENEAYSKTDYGMEEFIERVKELNLTLGSGHEIDRYEMEMRGYFQDAPEWKVCL